MCDKTIPAAAMAAARLDLPSVVLYGGSIMPGRLGEKNITIQDVFEAVGACAAGRISEEELAEVEKAACPGARRLRRTVHRANTMALGAHFPRPLAHGAEWTFRPLIRAKPLPRAGPVSWWWKPCAKGAMRASSSHLTA